MTEQVRDPRIPRLTEAAGFTEFIAGSWSDPDRTPPVVAGAAASAARHRELLSRAFPGRAIAIASGRAPVRINDTLYGFRPDTDFIWLTACSAEDAVLLMVPVHGGHDAVVYLPRPFYPGERGFFDDIDRGELWVGAAPDLADWSAALGMEVRDLATLDDALVRLPEVLVGGHAHRPPALGTTPADAELGRVLAHLRMVKDEFEIGQLRAAVDATVRGFADTLEQVPTALVAGGERWLQGTFDRTARTLGNGVGYATIVGSGANGATLHWSRTDGEIVAEDLLLLDMGVEMRSFYTADVTRTFPASGTFSAVQREVHDLVERSHRAGLAAVGPGHDFGEFFGACMEVIARGLADWGILPVSVDEALSPAGQQHRRWLACGIGHHLGIDVHDCARSSYAEYYGATLREGMVMTVEPGLYFHDHDLSVPPELRGIGVRIEDDVLVTGTGSEVLSAALPLDAAGLEAWMREAGGAR